MAHRPDGEAVRAAEQEEQHRPHLHRQQHDHRVARRDLLAQEAGAELAADAARRHRRDQAHRL